MDSVVKIDKELEEKIISLIKKERFLYTSRKQVVNLAIIEFLNQHGLNINKKKRKI